MIAILMATYNGQKYIAQQIDSILSQTYNEFQLYISDDCSSDNTVSILERYASDFPEKIKLIKREENSGSAKINFMELAVKIKADYIMFADQDDVWLTHKIENTLAAMRKGEVQYGRDFPLLVHTDLIVADENLKTIDNSFMHYMALDPNRNQLNQMIVQSNVNGCTIMYNRALSEKICTLPSTCCMHDWFCSLIATLLGRVIYLNESTILYRQHGGNEVGAPNTKSFLFLFKKIISQKENCIMMLNSFKQAWSLLELYDNSICNEKKKILEAYFHLREQNPLQRFYVINQMRFWKKGITRKIGQSLTILFMKQER